MYCWKAQICLECLCMFSLLKYLYIKTQNRCFRILKLEDMIKNAGADNELTWVLWIVAGSHGDNKFI